VPALRKGVYGLFDTCEMKFYPSETSVPFKGTVSERNDAIIYKKGITYQRLEYIQNDKTNYIDTGIILNYDRGFRVETEFLPTDYTGNDTRCCLLSNHEGDSNSIDMSLEIQDNQSRMYLNKGIHDFKIDNLSVLHGVNKSVHSYFAGVATNTLNGKTAVSQGILSGTVGSSLWIFVDRAKRFDTFSIPLKIYSLKI
jgi:hypothetical protein